AIHHARGNSAARFAAPHRAHGRHCTHGAVSRFRNGPQHHRTMHEHLRGSPDTALNISSKNRGETVSHQFLTSMFGLQDRTVLVTGGASGLGLCMASTVGQAGARVIVNDVREAACNEAVESLRAQGIDARSAVFDVSSATAVADAVAALANDR